VLSECLSHYHIGLDAATRADSTLALVKSLKKTLQGANDWLQFRGDRFLNPSRIHIHLSDRTMISSGLSI
jgi:hypothetical protein